MFNEGDTVLSKPYIGVGNVKGIFCGYASYEKLRGDCTVMYGSYEVTQIAQALILVSSVRRILLVEAME